MCGEGDLTIQDIAQLNKANGEMEAWDEGVNLVRRSQSKITQAFTKAVDDLRKEWAREVTKNATTQPQLLITGPRNLDWEGFATTIMEGWLAGTEQVLIASTRASLEASGLGFKELKKEEPAPEVIWGFEEKENQTNLWVENRGAQFGPAVTRSTRTAIEQIIQAGLNTDDNPRRVAKNVERVIGLTTRDANALFRRQQQLFDAGKNTAQVTRATDAYYKKLIKRRAETIARTEMMAARNQGTVNAWRMAQAQGVAPMTAQKEWVLGPNACPICEAIVAEGPVEVNQSFNSPMNGMTYDSPPAHPNCRCSMALV